VLVLGGRGNAAVHDAEDVGEQRGVRGLMPWQGLQARSSDVLPLLQPVPR
jgi:hypothetical protein